MSEEQAIVEELNAQFGTEIADIPERPSDLLPRMKAVFQIESAFLNRSQTSGRKQLTIACVIRESDQGEEHVGKKYKKNWGLETTENFQWLKKDIRALEIEPPNNAKEVLELCLQLEGICFAGQLVPNVDEAFPPNCYINKGARKHELESGVGGQSGSDIT